MVVLVDVVVDGGFVTVVGGTVVVIVEEGATVLGSSPASPWSAPQAAATIIRTIVKANRDLATVPLPRIPQ